jgi:signal transduction histidine kinase/ActR/RegA family two-component response regulator
MIGLSHVEAALKTNMISYYRQPEDRSDLVRRLKKHKKIEHYELELKQADGTPLQVLVNAIGRFDENGELTEILGYIMDVTHQKSLEKQLLQAQKMESIGTMAGGVAHDFNNLLMGIQGNVSMLLMNRNQDHRSQTRLENIMSLIERGSKLTRQLLGFAKGGKYEVRPSDLNDLIHRSSKVFRRTKKGLQVLEDFDPALWAVDADRSQIDQVFFNLYVNADHAMHGSGTLSLTSRNTVVDEQTASAHQVNPGRFVTVSVADTGIGMDETTLKRIFDPFYTTKELGHGTGLGLASAYGIIKNHGGFITVSSRVGQGTCFNIHLPASESEAPASHDQTSSIELCKGSETILVVDDEMHNLELSKEMLECLGYTVVTASSGRNAIEIYREKGHAIDMVVLDIVMPELGGGETFDALKVINADVRVLLASGYSINGEAARIIQRGCLGFIQKPFAIWELSRKAREILDQKKETCVPISTDTLEDRSVCLQTQA